MLSAVAISYYISTHQLVVVNCTWDDISIVIEHYLRVLPILRPILIEQELSNDDAVDIDQVDFIVDFVQVLDGSDPLAEQEGVWKKIRYQVK